MRHVRSRARSAWTACPVCVSLGYSPLSGSLCRIAWAPLSGASARSSAATRVLPRRVYFLSAALFSAGALDADFAIDVVGTMMWAYGVPFHITHGPPLVQSVGYASS